MTYAAKLIQDQLECWSDLPLIVIDFETTGPDEKIDVPCEMGLARFEHGDLIESASVRVKPTIPISAGATEVHGITDADVADCWTISDEISKHRHLFEGAYPVAYNANFDRTIFHRVFDFPYYREEALVFYPEWPWIDPLVWVREQDRYVKGTGRHKLEATCERHGIEHAGAHEAESDCIATGKLLYHFVDKIYLNGSFTIAELLRRQAIRAAEQEADFQKWLAKQNQETG